MAGPTYGQGFIDLKPQLASGFESQLSRQMSPIGSSVGGLFGAAMKTGVLAAVAGLGAIIGDAIGLEASGDRMAARLGLSEADAARLGDIAGASFTQNFGDSIAENQGVVEEVWRSFGDLGDQALQDITSGALGLADVFDQDVGEVIAAAQQLFVNDLAPDAQSALDIVAAALQGTQGPADEALSAITEYSTNFAQLGLDGSAVLGALTSEWATNQFAIDKVGDAVKEFGIRLADGTAESGLAELGFDIGTVQAAFDEGGPAAQTMFANIIDGLQGLGSPLEQARLGAEILGTPFEDLGAQAIPILQDVSTGLEDFGGTTEAITAQASDNIQGRLSTAWRTLRTSIEGAIGSTVLPLIENATTSFQSFFESVNDPNASPTLKGLGDSFRSIGESVRTIFDSLKVFWDEWGDEITALLLNAFEVISGVIGGVVQVIAGIIEFITGVFTGDWEKAWEGIKGIFEGVWNTIKSVVEGAVEQVLIFFGGFIEDAETTISGGIDNIVTFFRELPGKVLDALKGLAGQMLEIGKDIVGGLIEGITDLPGRLFDGLKNGIQSAVDGVKDFFGIGSPSKVFRDEIGRAFGEGIIVGFEGQASAMADTFASTVSNAQSAAVDAFDASAFTPDVTSQSFAATRTATASISAVDVEPTAAGLGGPVIGEVNFYDPREKPAEESLQEAGLRVAVMLNLRK